MKKNDINQNQINDWNDEDEVFDSSDVSDVDTIGLKYSSTQLRVIRETKDLSIDYLFNNENYGKSILDTSPAYQRRLRWSNKKRSLLIESLLLNIPIPPIFLYEKDYNEYEVVDGRQRVEAIINYLKNNFPLSGLYYWKELNGKRFNDLPAIIKKGLLRRSLSSIVLLAETTKPTDDIDIRTILFERLNTGGEKLNPQELRNAIYPGSFNKLLFELSDNKIFKKIWGIPDIKISNEDEIPSDLIENTLYKTMTDCELVLRYYTMKLIYEGKLKGSIKSALDKCMAIYQKANDLEISDLRSEFITSLNKMYNIFKENAFILPKTKRISRPLYDGLMVAYTFGIKAGNKLESENIIKNNLDNVLSNQEKYNILVGKSNTIEAVKERIFLSIKVLYK